MGLSRGYLAEVGLLRGRVWQGCASRGGVWGSGEGGPLEGGVWRGWASRGGSGEGGPLEGFLAKVGLSSGVLAKVGLSRGGLARVGLSSFNWTDSYSWQVSTLNVTSWDQIP